jgi:general secretion pathway protein G
MDQCINLNPELEPRRPVAPSFLSVFRPLLRTRPSPRSARAGFTLMEMLVVIVIIGMLSAMIVGISHVVTRNKQLAQCRSEMQQIMFLLDDYQLKIGKFPPAGGSDLIAIKGALDGLLGSAKVSAKTDFLDIWGQSFQYVRRNDTSCTIFSKGPDETSGDPDTDLDNVMPTE